MSAATGAADAVDVAVLDATRSGAPAGEPVVILPRAPLVLIPAAGAGAACEGDSCAF